MQNLTFVEKREYPRFTLGIPVSCFLPDSNSTIDGETYNISAIGLCVVTDKELPTSTYVYIYLHLVDNKGDIYRQGKIVWSNMNAYGKYRTGIHIEEPKLKPIHLVLRTISYQRNY